jgi:heme-degrading monooxygenase HmoA
MITSDCAGRSKSGGQDFILEPTAQSDCGIEVGCLSSKRRRRMIKVIVSYELKKGADMQPVFLKLRSYAMTFPGFISAENIVSMEDASIAALVYNWERPEDWDAWRNSKVRQQIVQEAEALLVSEPKITAYMIMPTSTWTYPRY